MVAGAAVARHLIVEVTDEANLQLLGQELRCAPIEVHIDAILILRRRIDQVVGEAEHSRQFMAGFRIEISVAAARIDRSMSNADIRQAGGTVVPDRDVASDVI
jgi:hypothetical protein